MVDINTAPIIKIPDLSKIQDPATKDVLEQLVRFIFDNQPNVFDDLTNINAAIPTVPSKASQAEAEAATDDTKYMTPLKVKNEVQYAGALIVPYQNVETGTTANKILLLDSNARIPAVDGRQVTNIDGVNFQDLADIPSGAGRVPIANLATGTPDGTKFIRDDGTLANASPSVTDDTNEQCQLYADTEAKTHSATTATKKHEVASFPLSGVITLTVDLSIGNALDTARAQVYINGVAQGSAQTTNSTIAEKKIFNNITVAAGDEIQLYTWKTEGGGGSSVTTDNLKIYGQYGTKTTGL